MARIDLPTQIQVPDEININLIREDYLDTSNIFRIFFEICLALSGALLGSILSLSGDGKDVSLINWIFLGVMVIGCISFLALALKNYNKAKSTPK